MMHIHTIHMVITCIYVHVRYIWYKQYTCINNITRIYNIHAYTIYNNMFMHIQYTCINNITCIYNIYIYIYIYIYGAQELFAQRLATALGVRGAEVAASSAVV